MSIARQFLKFALVGAVGTVVQYAVLWEFVQFLSISAPVSSAIGFALGSVVNYALNYLFTFASKKSHIEAATRYYLIVAVAFVINYGLMEFLISGQHWNYWHAQLLTTSIGLCWNFSGSRWWAFRISMV